jgi:hypothetical protein
MGHPVKYLDGTKNISLYHNKSHDIEIWQTIELLIIGSLTTLTDSK